MAQEEAIRGKEQDDETSGLSQTSVQTSALPPTLNFKRLESIQRLLQYGAAITLLVFLVLIVISSYVLDGTIKEIGTNGERIKEQNEVLANKETALEQSQIHLNQSNKKLAEQQKELDGQQEKVKKNEEIIKKQDEEINEKQKLIDGLKDVVNKSSQNGDKQITPLIYVHIAREDQRGRAAEIVKQLKNKGYIVPGIENVQDKAPKKISELRTCDSTDAAKADISDITKALKSLSVALKPPEYLTKDCDNARARLYELWFENDF